MRRGVLNMKGEGFLRISGLKWISCLVYICMVLLNRGLGMFCGWRCRCRLCSGMLVTWNHHRSPSYRSQLNTRGVAGLTKKAKNPFLKHIDSRWLTLKSWPRLFRTNLGLRLSWLCCPSRVSLEGWARPLSILYIILLLIENYQRPKLLGFLVFLCIWRETIK